jgi:hypothetical protein
MGMPFCRDVGTKGYCQARSALVGLLLSFCCVLPSYAAEPVRPLGADQLRVLTDELLVLLYQRQTGLLEQPAARLLAQDPRLTPAQQRLARYARVRFLLAQGQPESLSEAMDLSARIDIVRSDRSAGVTLPEVGLLARLEVILAARRLGVKSELLVFLLQTLQQEVADSRVLLDPESARLMASVQLMVWMTQWQTGAGVDMPQLSRWIALDSPWYATALVLQGVKVLLPVTNGPTLWLHSVPVAAAGGAVYPGRLDLFRLEQAMLQLQVLDAMGAVSIRSLFLQNLYQGLQQHIGAIRQWQHPERLDQLLAHWLRPVMMPDAAEPDDRFRAFVGCPLAGALTDDMDVAARCQPLSLSYLHPAIRSRSLRVAWVDRQESLALLARLNSLQADLLLLEQSSMPDARLLTADVSESAEAPALEDLLRGRQAAYDTQANYYYQLAQRHVYLSLLVYLAQERQRLTSYLSIVHEQLVELD